MNERAPLRNALEGMKPRNASWKAWRLKGVRKWVCWGMGAWVTYRKDQPLHVGIAGKYLGTWAMPPEAARAKLEQMYVEILTRN